MTGVELVVPAWSFVSVARSEVLAASEATAARVRTNG
jgi:hypothetical protein